MRPSLTKVTRIHPLHPLDIQQQRLGLEGTAEGDAALAPWRAKIDESYLDELGAALEAKAVEVRTPVVTSPPNPLSHQFRSPPPPPSHQ